MAKEGSITYYASLDYFDTASDGSKGTARVLYFRVHASKKNDPLAEVKVLSVRVPVLWEGSLCVNEKEYFCLDFRTQAVSGKIYERELLIVDGRESGQFELKEGSRCLIFSIGDDRAAWLLSLCGFLGAPTSFESPPLPSVPPANVGEQTIPYDQLLACLEGFIRNAPTPELAKLFREVGELWEVAASQG